MRSGAGSSRVTISHPAGNIARMAAGHPLDDADRAPWLDAVAARIAAFEAAGASRVIACSALKRRYRDRLLRAGPCWFVLLSVRRAALAARLADRTGHFMPPALLDSQLATLEPLAPDEPGTTIDARGGIADSVAAIRAVMPRD